MADPWWEREKWAVDLVPYVILIRAFLEDRLTGPEFQLLYFALFKSDDRRRLQGIFDILDRLFADVDEYCSDPDLRQRVGGINEQELRVRARAAEENLAAAAQEHLP